MARSGLPRPDRAGSVVGVLEELALEVERLVAPQDPPDDLDVLAGAGQRLVRRTAVPALHHLGTRHAQAQLKRPLERWSRVRAAMAVAVGVRAASCTTLVPSLMVEVCPASQPSGVKASDPQASAVHTES